MHAGPDTAPFIVLPSNVSSQGRSWCHDHFWSRYGHDESQRIGTESQAERVSLRSPHRGGQLLSMTATRPSRDLSLFKRT